MISAAPMHHESVDMGFTGEVTAIRVDLLLNLLDLGITPVVAPICLGVDNNFNVNGDHVAGAVAAAVEAERLVFLSNVAGVLVDNALVGTLTPEQAEGLIADGTIFGGMVPKVRTARWRARRRSRAGGDHQSGRAADERRHGIHEREHLAVSFQQSAKEKAES
ncbi:MAG: hypothetical protein U0521_08155 [Anaerolineae bacterium]